MKDFRVEAVARVSAVTAIQLGNRMQMQTLAWRFTFDEEKFPLDEQLALSVVSSQSYSREGNATTTQTHSALSKMLGLNRGKGERILRKLENVYLRQDKNEDSHKVFHWRLKDREMAKKMDELAELFGKIEKVILAQISDPENPEAGRELVPESVYFNVVDNHARYQNGKEA
mgnify:CR=1 FL=1